MSQQQPRQLDITAEQLDALREGCKTFDPDDLIAHVKGCDDCTATILRTKLFSTQIVRVIADMERLFRQAEPGTAATRMTKYMECERCGAEIYGCRNPDPTQRGVFWANRLDRRGHSCADFRKLPDVVQSWTPSKRGGTRLSPSKRWTP